MAVQASTPLEKLKEQLTCVVCLDLYTNPKNLPCLHSFCLQCLERLPLDPQGDNYFIACPTCRHRTQLPPEGPAGFPAAFRLQTSIETYNAMIKSDGSYNSNIDKRILQKAISEGYVETEVTTVVVQGEARIGKTCVKCLLVGEEYTGSSTGCIEAPSLAVRCYKKRKGNSYWERVSEEEMEKHTMETVQHDANNIPITEYTLPEYTTAPLATELDETLTRSIITNVENATPPSDLDNALTKVSQFYDQCRSKYRKRNTLRGRQWLHFIDSGGQIQFQKLLPAFMPCASVILLVVSLAKNLSSPSCQELQCTDGRKIESTGHSMKVEEIIKHLLSSVSSNAQRYQSSIANDPVLSQCIQPPSVDHKLKITAIATHRDKYDETKVESPETKQEILARYFKSMKSTCTIVGNTSQVTLHEVDGRKAHYISTCGQQQQPTDPVIEKISAMLDDNAYKIKVPLKWYCFDVLLHMIVSSPSHCGVLTLSYCETLGSQLAGMKPDEVVNALKFLHFLNKILFYPSSGPGSDLVFVNVSSLIDIIKDLVIFILDYTDGCIQEGIKLLATEGKLTLQVLERSPHFQAITQYIDNFGHKLLSIFQHLLIATKLTEMTELPENEDQYLMPALLPIKDVSYNIVPFGHNTVPFVFYFEKCVPMGLFCALLVHLLSFRTQHSHWRTIKEHGSNYSNYFTLQNYHLRGTFVLVEQINCIEVHCDQLIDRYEAKESIAEAITQVLDTHKLSRNDKQGAFYCHCRGTKHPAVVRRSQRRNESFCECTNTSREVDINNEQHLSWITAQHTQCVSGPDTTQAGELNGCNEVTTTFLDTTSLSDVLSVLKSKRFDSTSWFRLGIFLGLYYETLEKIRVEERDRVDMCFTRCLVAWLSRKDGVEAKGGPTWSTLDSALNEIDEAIQLPIATQTTEETTRRQNKCC